MFCLHPAFTYSNTPVFSRYTCSLGISVVCFNLFTEEVNGDGDTKTANNGQESGGEGNNQKPSSLKLSSSVTTDEGGGRRHSSGKLNVKSSDGKGKEVCH